MSAALGLGKVKDLAGRAKEAAKEQVIKADASRAVTPVGAPRKVRVLISRIDPWSVLKLGFLLSIAAGIMLVVAVHVLWQVLNAMGTFELAREWVSKLFTENSELNILPFFEYKKIMSATVLIAVVDVLLLTGLSTLGAFLYNSVSRVVGGIYMTLTDD